MIARKQDHELVCHLFSPLLGRLKGFADSDNSHEDHFLTEEKDQLIGKLVSTGDTDCDD